AAAHHATGAPFFSIAAATARHSSARAGSTSAAVARWASRSRQPSSGGRTTGFCRLRTASFFFSASPVVVPPCRSSTVAPARLLTLVVVDHVAELLAHAVEHLRAVAEHLVRLLRLRQRRAVAAEAPPALLARRRLGGQLAARIDQVGQVFPGRIGLLLEPAGE